MRLADGMACPICEDGTLKSARRKIRFTYKGTESFVEGSVFECDRCGESFWDEKDEREIERRLTDERRKVDGLLTSHEIRSIRKRFGFSQVQFAKVLDIGHKNFARYESGQSVQGRTTDHLLRILMHMPEALEIISKEKPGWETERLEATGRQPDEPPQSDSK